MSELPDYEVEIVVQGARFPVFGYVAVRGKSTREALDEVVRLIEKRVGVSWRDSQDKRVRWDDFARADMDVQVADITPYGSKWNLRRYADAASSGDQANE